MKILSATTTYPTAAPSPRARVIAMTIDIPDEVVDPIELEVDCTGAVLAQRVNEALVDLKEIVTDD